MVGHGATAGLEGNESELVARHDPIDAHPGQLRRERVAEAEARSREAIQYGGVLSNMGPERMQLAMQAAGMGGNPSALSGTLSNLMGINQQQGMYNQQNQSQLWSGLGSLAAIIARSGQSGLSGVRT